MDPTTYPLPPSHTLATVPHALRRELSYLRLLALVPVVGLTCVFLARDRLTSVFAYVAPARARLADTTLLALSSTILFAITLQPLHRRVLELVLHRVGA